jgi:glycine cleavage system H lipoate-binding protein
MTVILVLATFIAFLLIDHFFSKKTVLVAAEARSGKARPAMPLDASLVNGFKVPENLRYHPGHAWALSESPSLVRVGMDDFSSKLVGKIDSVTLPQRGQWVRQGQKIWSVLRNGVKVDMVSPIEGSIADINEAVAANPELALRDPYGEGWMVTVQSPDAKTNFRNLLGGALARWWMEEASGRLQKHIPAFAMVGAVAQDGGVAVNNLTSDMDDKEFAEIAKEFLLS